MLDKVKVNASKGNPNASSHEIAKTMLFSVVARRTQLIELAVGLDATMEIPNGGGGSSICDLLLRAIPAIIPMKISKFSFTVHLVDIWVMSAVLKTGVLRRRGHYLEFMIWIEASSRREMAQADLIDKNAKPYNYNLPTEEMERIYMSNGGFKPPAQFQTCVKCGHNLVDKPAQNKSAMRDNKRVQLQSLR